MFRILFTLFILIPLLEIYLLIKVGGTIGALPTVLLVIFTAVLGALLLRHQGLFTYARVQASLARGELPTLAMLEGVVLLISGAMLLTPGFFTDALGFLGLVPPLRQWLILKLLQGGMIQTMGPASRHHHPHDGPRTLDGEYRREDDL
ncbi:MAG: FxsA family protein [Gammaproteobacteria bacterium]|nr:FxsA family protein [Gammaproteobacteria bacterium]MCW8840257.1 FxsA family protein [Gammaproteobacteria bacterium]MCW8927477.1 FxsA family protein [Gammaproteobacteria bacterium]MCW8959484.1 FxsA family protein [Gammaproteobacteria bacterium]MCW8971777.1 FxsA family protein [Gammaproteobacteria bacterium]